MQKPLRNIFSDRSSLILRTLLREPKRRWRIRDFIEQNVSFSLANQALNRAWELGLVVRVKKGRNSYTLLKNKNRLLTLWEKSYSFSHNITARLHYTGNDFYKDWDTFLKKKGIKYTFTLFSVSRLLSPFVLDQNHYVYVDVSPQNFKSFVESLKNHMGLLELKSGGNVTVALPYYKSSVFQDMQKIQKVPCVSNIQLYLDLVSYPAGSEEIEHLQKFFMKKDENFV